MYSQGRSKLSIAAQTGVSRNTAKKYMAAFEASGLTFEQVNSLNDKELDDFFGTVKQMPPQDRLVHLQRCFPRIDKELKKPGETRYRSGRATKRNSLTVLAIPNSASIWPSGSPGSIQSCTRTTRQEINSTSILLV